MAEKLRQSWNDKAFELLNSSQKYKGELRPIRDALLDDCYRVMMGEIKPETAMTHLRRNLKAHFAEFPRP